MLVLIVYYPQKEDKSARQKGASSMKKNNVMAMDRKYNGYELMGKGMSVNVMRTYWKGSPWKALRDCVRHI